MKKFTIILVFSFLLTSCFKVGYVLEFGSANEKKKEAKSGYYYKNPTYHIK